MCDTSVQIQWIAFHCVWLLTLINSNFLEDAKKRKAEWNKRCHSRSPERWSGMVERCGAHVCLWYPRNCLFARPWVGVFSVQTYVPHNHMVWALGASRGPCWASLVVQTVKNPPTMRETWAQSLGWEDAWRRAWQPTPVFLPGEFPWTKEPGRLQSTGSQRVGHNWATKHKGPHYIVNTPILMDKNLP